MKNENNESELIHDENKKKTINAYNQNYEDYKKSQSDSLNDNVYIFFVMFAFSITY